VSWDADYVGRDYWPDAACRGLTSLMTLPALGRPSRHATVRIAQAKTLCRTCPVHDECLAWALSVPDPAVGMIAGGTTPAERRRMRATGGDRLD
jgi:WhiB family redox-sensing transcriptional regulator